MCDDARSKGITGVPVIIIDGKWLISGAQPSDVFIQVSFFKPARIFFPNTIIDFSETCSNEVYV